MFCWIATEVHSDSIKLMTILYYSITWLIIVLNCFFVVKVLTLLRKELQNEKELMDKYSSKLRLYPMVQIISFIPATVNRIYGMATGESSFGLLLVQCIFDSLTGLMFSIVYGYNASVRNALGDCIRTLCCKKGQRGSVMSNTQNNRSRSLTFIDDTLVTESSMK